MSSGSSCQRKTPKSERERVFIKMIKALFWQDFEKANELANKMTFYIWTWWIDSSWNDRDINEVSSANIDGHLLVDRNVSESGFNVDWRSFNVGTLPNAVPRTPKYPRTPKCWDCNWTNSLLIWPRSPVICSKSTLISSPYFAFFHIYLPQKLVKFDPKNGWGFFDRNHEKFDSPESNLIQKRI